MNELFGANGACLLRFVECGRDDLRFVQRSAFGDICGRRGDSKRVPRIFTGAGRGVLLVVGNFAGRDIESVEFTTCCGFCDGFAGRVVRDVVAVYDVVVPVPLTLLECCALESEGSFPAASFGRVLGEGQLAIVIVPGAEQVDGFDIGRSAQGEVELDGGHAE